MKQFVEKLIGRLEKKSVEHRETGFEMERKGFSNIADKQYAKQIAYLNAIEIVNQLAEEYNDSWITDRAPTKEECKGWRGTFQATILQGIGDEQYTTTVALQYEYTTVRGKEVSRWLFKEKIAPWEPIAWKPLSEPYQL